MPASCGPIPRVVERFVDAHSEGEAATGRRSFTRIRRLVLSTFMSAGSILLFETSLVFDSRVWIELSRALVQSGSGLWFDETATDWTSARDWTPVREERCPRRSGFLAIDDPWSRSARVLVNFGHHRPDPDEDPRFESAPWGLRWPEGARDLVRRSTAYLDLQALFRDDEPLDFLHALTDAAASTFEGFVYDGSTETLTSYDGGVWKLEGHD
jgi:hypothetical protein